MLLFGSAAQKEQFLPLVCDEKAPALTAAMTEPGYFFDPHDLKTTATPDGDGYRLDGAKCFVPLAAGADYILVYAQEGDASQGFIVAGDAAGLAVSAPEKNMGLNALLTYELTLENVAGQKLGGEAGCDFAHLLSFHKVALAAMAEGVARAASEYARAYAKERVQFGEPIAHRQSIAFMLAEMAIEVDAARMMVWEAAWKLDQGQRAVKEAYLAKMYADDMVLQVTDRGVQALGGYGYIREYPVELWLRNGRGFAAFDGLATV